MARRRALGTSATAVAVGRLLLECGGYRLACVTLLLPERLTTNINSTGLVSYSPGSQKSKIRVN